MDILKFVASAMDIFLNTNDRIKAELMNIFSKCLHCRSR
jgi:hypothetical protein